MESKRRLILLKHLELMSSKRNSIQRFSLQLKISEQLNNPLLLIQK